MSREISNVAMMQEPLAISVAAEQSLLGILLLDTSRCGAAMRAGGADLFGDPLHADVFEVIRKKDGAGELVSPITVADVIRGHEGIAEVGGVGYLARLVANAPAPSAAQGYIDMLADLKRKRGIAQAIAEAGQAIAKGEDASELIAGRLEAAIVAVQATSSRKGPVSMAKAVTVAMEQVKGAFEGSADAAIKTGIWSLDSIISGLYPGELVLLGGRPSMGKSAVALTIGLNAARAGHGVCIASLEMNPEAMALRALSEATSHAGNAVYYSKMRRGDMSDAQVKTLMECAQEVADLPLMFLSREHQDVGALIAGAKQVSRTMLGNLRLLIVDYAQLLRANGASRYDQVSEVSLQLKALSGQLNVPVLALSQLSRKVEERDDKRPMLSDLRESGQLEQDADAVLFCYRDEYYLERSQPKKSEHLEAWQGALDKARNRLEIIVAKQRQGEVRTAHVRFAAATNRIWEDRQ